MISNYKGENGAAILNHMFGDKKENIINSVSKSSGLDMNSTSNLMSMLAPFILEFLGKNKKEQKQHLRYCFRSWRAARDSNP